jgi:hypothetical protein
MNLTARAKLAHMRRVIMALQSRTPRPRERPRLIPLAMLRALYQNSLNDATRTYLQRLKRKGTGPWKLPN